MQSTTIDALTIDMSQKQMRRFASQSNISSPDEVQTKKGMDVIDLELLKIEFEIDYLDLNQVFTCSLEDTSNTGRLVITPKILGYIGQDQNLTTKIRIHLHDIVNIEKRNTASVFPNAIRVYTIQNHYTFVSFLKRNAAHKLIFSCWDNACREFACSRSEIPVRSPFANIQFEEEQILSPRISQINPDDGSMQSKLLGVVELRRSASEEIKSSTKSQEQLLTPPMTGNTSNLDTPVKIKQALDDIIELKIDPSIKEVPQSSSNTANDQVKAFWSTMGKSLATIQAQITEKTKPRPYKVMSTNVIEESSELRPQGQAIPRPPAPLPDINKKLLKSIPSVVLGDSLKSVVLEKTLKLKSKYVYRFLFESPLLQRTLQSQGATDLEITHWSNANYQQGNEVVKCNQRTISYKVQRPTDTFKFTDVHYLVNCVEGKKYLIEVQSSGVPITSTGQGPTYVAVHRIEINEEDNHTKVIISFRVDYKKNVFQESKVDKRVADRVKKFYQEEIAQIEKGFLKIKKRPKSSIEEFERKSTISQIMWNFIVSLNVDGVLVSILICIVLANIFLFLSVLLRSFQ